MSDVIFQNEEWLIKPMISQKGHLCICVYYKGMHMGFCNVGDFKTQQMFLNFNYPHLVDESNKIKEKIKERTVNNK